jgi:hypothetical protein
MKIVQAQQKFCVELIEVHGLTLWQRIKLIAGYNINIRVRMFCPHNPGPDTSGVFYVSLTDAVAKKNFTEEASQP